jgi:hypothetical protein
MNKNCVYTAQGFLACKNQENVQKEQINKQLIGRETFAQGGQCTEINKKFLTLMQNDAACTQQTDSVTDPTKCTYKVVCNNLASSQTSTNDPMQANMKKTGACTTMNNDLNNLLSSYKCSTDFHPDKCTYNFTCLD